MSVPRRRTPEAFDLVVSNADVHHTYAKLFSHEKSARRKASHLARMDWSMSLFVLYFGTDRTYRDEVVHHTVIFGPRYRELLEDIFHGRRATRRLQPLSARADRHRSQPGTEGLRQLLRALARAAPGPRPDRLGRVGPVYADRILGYLERCLPDLRSTWSSSVGSRRRASRPTCAPSKARPSPAHPRSPRAPGSARTIATPTSTACTSSGAGTHPGAGLPGVINSAKATAKVIMEDFR